MPLLYIRSLDLRTIEEAQLFRKLISQFHDSKMRGENTNSEQISSESLSIRLATSRSTVKDFVEKELCLPHEVKAQIHVMRISHQIE